MTFKHVVLAIIATLVLCGCRRTDVRDFEIKVPELTRKNAGLVGNELMKFEGVADVAMREKKSIVVDEASKTVKVRYDSMKVAKKNLEMAIALIGLEANGVTPESVGAKRSVVAKPDPAQPEAKPAETKSAEAKPTEAKPAETKPAEAK